VKEVVVAMTERIFLISFVRDLRFSFQSPS